MSETRSNANGRSSPITLFFYFTKYLLMCYEPRDPRHNMTSVNRRKLNEFRVFQVKLECDALESCAQIVTCHPMREDGESLVFHLRTPPLPKLSLIGGGFLARYLLRLEKNSPAAGIPYL